MLTHLLTREITHAKMFMKALESMGKLDDPMFGNVAPDDTVKLVFNLSQGEDERGPWNEAPDFDYIARPEPQGGFRPRRSTRTTRWPAIPRSKRGRAPGSTKVYAPGCAHPGAQPKRRFILVSVGSYPRVRTEDARPGAQRGGAPLGGRRVQVVV